MFALTHAFEKVNKGLENIENFLEKMKLQGAQSLEKLAEQAEHMLSQGVEKIEGAFRIDTKDQPQLSTKAEARPETPEPI